jgi:geranylgeranyl diphosphate synthase, type I
VTGRTSTPTDQVAAVRRSVDDALARRVQVLHAQVDAFGSEATVLVDALEAMLAGGKRLRPAFTWWG